jgi:hypothetical protein
LGIDLKTKEYQNYRKPFFFHYPFLSPQTLNRQPGCPFGIVEIIKIAGIFTFGSPVPTGGLNRTEHGNMIF